MMNSSYRCVWQQIAAVAVLVVCLCMAAGKLHAQAYFHFALQERTTAVSYNCFLRLEADGTASLRMAYSRQGSPVLAELLLRDSAAAAGSRFLVPATAPRFFNGVRDDSLRLPVLRFEERTDSTGVFYEPVAASLLLQGSGARPALLEQLQQKTFEQLVQEQLLVQQFFQVNDPFYQLLYGLSSRGLTVSEQRRKFYLLILANTNDASIGKTVEKDVQSLTELCTAITRQAGITLVSITIAGNAFNIGNTQRVLDTIRPAADDIVFFYYSGHGFRFANDVNKFPRISFRTNTLQVRTINNLSVQDVYNRLLAKKARVTIVVSDCCNERLGASVPVGEDMLRPRAAALDGLKLNVEQFRRLFLPAKPVSVLLASAAPNELAVSNARMGGFFTNFLRTELQKSLYTNTGENTWMRIALKAADNTRRQSLTALCSRTPNTQGRCLQRAEVQVLPPL